VNPPRKYEARDEEFPERRPGDGSGAGGRAGQPTESILLKRSANIYATAVMTGQKPRPAADDGPPPERPESEREDRMSVGVWGFLRRKLGLRD
jgi:hypothetical protein